METVAAICAFASGRPVEYKLPVFPVRTEEELARLKVLRHDPAVLGLARDGISLNIFNFPLDTILRLRGSLLAYHAALQQLSPDVAGMLFVTAIEALFSPRAEWRKEKATQRFIKSLIELCPEAIDQIASHANVEEAFSWKRKGGQALQRKEMLDAMYESRSDPTHAGLGISNTGVFSGMASPGGMRVALLSDLSRAAILEFLKAPRSSLIGHPMFAAPPATGK
jgi:hypothetical protein